MNDRNLVTSPDGHTFVSSGIGPGSFVVDAGCRGFGFTRTALAMGATVLALDADPDVILPGDLYGHPRLRFRNVALVPAGRAENYEARLYRDNGTEGYTTRRGTEAKSVLVPAMTLADLFRDHPRVDVLKLDVEGEEYALLDEVLAGNYDARQISVEFHDFLGGGPTHPNDDVWHAGFRERSAARFEPVRYAKTPAPWEPHPPHYLDVLLAARETP